MAMEICRKHQAQKSIGHCETCHAPVCELCVVRSANPKLAKKCFCSEDHREKFETYMAASGGKRQVAGVRPPYMIVAIFKAAFTLALIYLAVWYLKPSLIPSSLRFF